MRTLQTLWQRGFVSTFLAGFFAILPIAITIAIMSWVGGILAQWAGPDSLPGRFLQFAGGKLWADSSPMIASFLGWATVLVSIWLLGVLVKSATRYKAEEMFHGALGRLPLLNKIYGPVSQVVSMLKGGQDDMQGMSVVYCEFGAEHGGGFLALQAGSSAYQFSDQKCYVIYIPTSPVPMSGGIVFVPTHKVRPVDMEIDDLMQIYFSLGVMATKTVPEQYLVAAS